MTLKTNTKYPPNLVLIAALSGGLTIAVSLTYILLSIVFIVFRFNCDAFSSSSTTGAEYFWQTTFRIYGLSSACDYSFSILALTHESTVLILVSLTLAFSVITLATSGCLVTIIQDERQSRYLSWAVYAFVASCFASLIIDITTASHFGADHTQLSKRLSVVSPGSPSNYLTEVIRQAALWLMVISMKLFVTPLINCIFLILLVIYTREFQNTLKNEQHPIHKLGVLTAFDSKKPEENFTNTDIYNGSPFSRGPKINNGYVEDDSPPRSPLRRPEPPRSDYYSSLSFDRSNSWQRPQSSTPQNNRAFSYLEDIRRPQPQKSLHPQTLPIDKSSSWRRDPWPQPETPPVPAPDYSPTQPRRLKSALKPAYM